MGFFLLRLFWVCYYNSYLSPSTQAFLSVLNVSFVQHLTLMINAIQNNFGKRGNILLVHYSPRAGVLNSSPT